MSRAEIIAYHGWGFDRGCWQALRSQLPDKVNWLDFDRGYFGNACHPEFSASAVPKIILTHSFGLHLCPDNLLKHADILIMISGFLTFHPDEQSSKMRSERILQKMIRQFERHPRNVLHQFYQKVFYPHQVSQAVPDTINSPLLLDDLHRLNDSERSIKTLQSPNKICILHGLEDAIVSVDKSLSLKHQLKNDTHFYEHGSAGHALPMTHPTWCYDALIKFINN